MTLRNAGITSAFPVPHEKRYWGVFHSQPTTHSQTCPAIAPIRSLWGAWAGAKKKMALYFTTGPDRRAKKKMLTEKQRKARNPWRLPCRLTQNVFVPHQHGLVDLCLSEPAGLLGGEEHLHSYLLATPPSHPHLPVATFSDLFHHLNLLSDSPLNLLNPKTQSV